MSFKRGKVFLLNEDSLRVREREYPCILEHSWMFGGDRGKLVYTHNNIRTPTRLKHIIVVDIKAEIKEGDLIATPGFSEYLVQHAIKEHLNSYNYSDCYKIVATTDPMFDLPRPSEAFIKKYIELFNENKDIENVLIDIDSETFDTIKVDKNNTISIRKPKEFWTREEVMDLLLACENRKVISEEPFVQRISIEEWAKEYLI